MSILFEPLLLNSVSWKQILFQNTYMQIPGPTLCTLLLWEVYDAQTQVSFIFLSFPGEFILMFQQFGEPLSCKWLKKAILEKVLNNK